jgi:hypothetical protein
LIGLIFGIIDWFYLDWLAHISWGNLGQTILVVPIILAMNYGIWLVPSSRWSFMKPGVQSEYKIPCSPVY